ncbi:hypothetical protein Glove_107g8 [Diversispora epigaea]|uniref:Uncharacterized protein n=1 Tax=Diversispora epigaea TaxID=1348612 RepID=A0A397J9F8_9GLOM|nr:hypothetical protein Glove_107g8 [Diversispora epigaea]
MRVKKGVRAARIRLQNNGRGPRGKFISQNELSESNYLKANNGTETNSGSNYNTEDNTKDDDIEDDDTENNDTENNDTEGNNILIKNLPSFKLYWTPKKRNYTGNSRATKYRKYGPTGLYTKAAKNTRPITNYFISSEVYDNNDELPKTAPDVH